MHAGYGNSLLLDFSNNDLSTHSGCYRGQSAPSNRSGQHGLTLTLATWRRIGRPSGAVWLFGGSQSVIARWSAIMRQALIVPFSNILQAGAVWGRSGQQHSVDYGHKRIEGGSSRDTAWAMPSFPWPLGKPPNN